MSFYFYFFRKTRKHDLFERAVQSVFELFLKEKKKKQNGGKFETKKTSLESC